jgi:hypothetical protein
MPVATGMNTEMLLEALCSSLLLDDDRTAQTVGVMPLFAANAMVAKRVIASGTAKCRLPVGMRGAANAERVAIACRG